jgi:tRNA(fMet)-specific endonuclease VapC
MKMANLQIKDIDDKLYQEIKDLAASESRSVTQEVLFLLKDYLSKRKHLTASKTAAQVLIDLSGSWQDQRSATEIVSEIKKARKKSVRLAREFWLYLLDTDTIIFSLKGNAVVKDNLKKHLRDPIKISVITLMELYCGAYKSAQTTVNLAKIGTFEDSIEVIPLTAASAHVFGALKATLEGSGAPLDDFELALASCALAHNLVLVTNNTKHFRRVKGLTVENWTVDWERKSGVGCWVLRVGLQRWT